MPELYAAVVPVKDGAGAVLGTIRVSGELRMSEYRDWTLAELTSNWGRAYPYLARLIKEWFCTHPGPPEAMTELDPKYAGLMELKGTPLDPAKVESYDLLDARTFWAVSKAVGRWLRQEPESKN